MLAQKRGKRFSLTHRDGTSIANDEDNERRECDAPARRRCSAHGVQQSASPVVVCLVERLAPPLYHIASAPTAVPLPASYPLPPTLPHLLLITTSSPNRRATARRNVIIIIERAVDRSDPRVPPGAAVYYLDNRDRVFFSPDRHNFRKFERFSTGRASRVLSRSMQEMHSSLHF